MQNQCLIIMPPGEPNGYPQGHVNRVYDFIIVPACRLAGYWPKRADIATYHDPLDAIKEMVDSDIAICDISADNSNALYALAIRHALGLPVTLVKDTKTFVHFSANEFGVVEFDESLRIDTVQKAIETLSAALKNAVEKKKERHELLNRLSIGLPKVYATEAPSETTSPPEEPIPQREEPENKKRLPIISPLPDYVGEPLSEVQITNLKAGDVFFHLNHGRGKVNFVKKMGQDKVANIQFEAGAKLLVLVASDFFRTINH